MFKAVVSTCRRSRWLTAVGLLLFYEAVAVLLLRHVAIDGTATFLWGGDSSNQSYAWLMKVWHQARVGNLALWDFGIQSGTSFAGELQTAPFYPVALLFAPLVTSSDPFFVDLFIVLHFGLGACFMHGFLRCNRLSLPACFIGAIIFAFVGSVAIRAQAQPNLFCGLVFMPAVALCACRAMAARHRLGTLKWSVLGGIALAMLILAGHVHGYIHMAIGLVLLLVALKSGLGPSGYGRSVVIGAIMVAISIGMAAIALVPTAEYLRLAYKWYGSGYTRAPHIVPFGELQHWVLGWRHAGTLLNLEGTPQPADSGSLFLTDTGLLLALVSLADWRRPLVRFGWLAVAVALILATSGSGMLGLVIAHIPGLDLVRTPSRALHLYAFAAAALAAAGADAAHRLCLTCLPGVRRRLFASLVTVLLLCLTLMEVQSFAVTLAPPEGGPDSARKDFVENPVIADIERLTAADGVEFRYRTIPADIVPPNAPEIRAIFGTWGFRSSALGTYTELFWQADDLASPLNDLLSVRYVVSEAPLPGLDRVGTEGKYGIYERGTALPMFRLSDPDGTRHPERLGSVAWRCNSVTLRLDGDRPGNLVFAQMPFPGWHVYVDGRERPLGHVDGFQSVVLVSGDREVEFAYRPAWLPWLAGLSAAIALSCIALFLRDRAVSDGTAKREERGTLIFELDEARKFKARVSS